MVLFQRSSKSLFHAELMLPRQPKEKNFKIYLVKNGRSDLKIIWVKHSMERASGSVVECLTRDGEAADSSLTGVT